MAIITPEQRAKVFQETEIIIDAAEEKKLANEALGDLITKLDEQKEALVNIQNDKELTLTSVESQFLIILLKQIDSVLQQKEQTSKELKRAIIDGSSHPSVKELLDLVDSIDRTTITTQLLSDKIIEIKKKILFIQRSVFIDTNPSEQDYIQVLINQVKEDVIDFETLLENKLLEKELNKNDQWMVSFIKSMDNLKHNLDDSNYNPKNDKISLIDSINLLRLLYTRHFENDELELVELTQNTINQAEELLVLVKNKIEELHKKLSEVEVQALPDYINLKDIISKLVNNNIPDIELRKKEINDLITDLTAVSKDFDNVKKEIVSNLIEEAEIKLADLQTTINKIKEEEEIKPEVILRNTQFFSSLIDFMNHATGGVSGSAVGVVGTNAKIADWPPEMQAARKTYQVERTKLEGIKDSYDSNSKEFKWIENALKMGSQIYSHWDYSFSNMNGRTGGVDHQPGNASMDNQIVPKRARELMDFYNFIDIDNNGKRHKNGPYFEIKQIALYLLSGYKIKLDTRSSEDSNFEMTWLGDNAELFRGSVYYANYAEQSDEMWKTALFLYSYKKGIITKEEFDKSFFTKGGRKRIKDGSYEDNEEIIFRKLSVLQKNDLLNSEQTDLIEDKILAVSDEEIAEMHLFWEDVKTNMVFGGLPGEAYAYTALAGSSQAHEGFKLSGEVEGKRDFSLASRPLSAIAYLINNKPGTTDSMVMMLVAYSDKSIVEVMQRSGGILTQKDQESDDDFKIRKENPMSYFRTPMRHMYEETKAWLNVSTEEHYLTAKMNAMHDCPMLDESILVNGNMVASRYFGVDASGFVYISEKYMEVFGDLDESDIAHKFMKFHSSGPGKAKLLDIIPGNQIIGTYQGYVTRLILSYKDNNQLFVNQVKDIPLINKIPLVGPFINERKSKLQDQIKYEKLDNLRRHLANEMLSATTIKFMRGITAVEELFQDADGVFSRNEYKESWEDSIIGFNDNQKKSAAQAMLRKRILEKIFNAKVEFVDGTKKDSKEIKITKFDSIPKQFKRTKRFKEAEEYIHMVWEHLKKDSLIAKTRHGWSKFKGKFSENGFLDIVKPPIHIKDVVQKKDK